MQDQRTVCIMENTKERIERCAVKEFTDKGFNGASLRQIVRDAGVTTGAFYRYYPTKEALFDGIVGPCVNHVYDIIDGNYSEFIKKDLDEQVACMMNNSDSLIDIMLDYIYDHLDIFRLVLTASEGTPYTDFIHNLAEREEKSTLKFAELMRENGMDVPELDKQFVHMVSSGLYTAIFEIVLHDMDKVKARGRIILIEKFYSAGWEKILGIDF